MKNNNWIWIIVGVIILTLVINPVVDKKEFSKKEDISIKPTININDPSKKSTMVISPPPNCIPGTQYGTGISDCWDGWRDMHFDNEQYTVSYKFTTCDNSEILSSGTIQPNTRKTETCPPDKWCHYIYANYDCSGNTQCPSGQTRCSDGVCKTSCDTTQDTCKFYQDPKNCSKIAMWVWIAGGFILFMFMMAMMK